MSNTPDNNLSFDFKISPHCRVAYSLNNGQPVRCTHIGDEPMFYMDYESAMEDETGFDDAFDAIERGLIDLREKISTIDQLATMADSHAGEVMNQFLDDLAVATQPRRAGKPGSTFELESVLRQSRLAASFLDFAATFGSSLRYGTQSETATYDRASGTIYINPEIDHADQILLAVRELRRLWQHRNGALLHPLTFHPDQSILVNRAQVADLSVTMVRIAWELQLAGQRDAWERIENSSMADLGRAFARESFNDFRSLNNGVAASAVFEAWFLSDRCRHEDRQLIRQMLADYRGYVFEALQTSQNVTAELIFALGSMPFGKNYLAPFVQTIMNDSVFTDVRDRSNANFLWFIKFERSFRETEQELQTEQSVRDPGARPGASPTKKERIGTDEKTGTIIALPFGKADTSPAAARQQHAGGGARIIAFRTQPDGQVRG